MAQKKTNTIKRYLTSKLSQSHERTDQVRPNGPLSEQAQPSYNPLSEASRGIFGDLIDLNRVSSRGVGSVGQDNASKWHMIKGLDLSDEDFYDEWPLCWKLLTFERSEINNNRKKRKRKESKGRERRP